ncbi:thiol:disulfide interchange protein DsbA/DsbL [Biformimicrobium ophioploci]|uniref:Thiol:disulfide interchange protein n=1 Tax=Biformimicrobium ophioploci TaxID=3036711 RepID=A0ABQ6LV82_9GAMM|nr:thiol:disulfide interchange protein DsbA/DsbL [Microbulbifer sp. NKW57]GMG85993.1 thiol:disulfide interchange protein DsbA [Microbulbifer sp. NKW57]
MRAVVALFSMILSLAACAQDSSQFKAGEHYQVLPRAVPQANASKIEINEVFWYGCGHCYTFEPVFNGWSAKLPADVDVVKTPAVWQPVMEVHARLYYIAKAMGVLDKMHQPLFNAITQERKTLAIRNGRNWTPDTKAIEDLFNAHGADGAKAVKMLNSFGITSQVRQGQAKQRAYAITGTPELVVAGKYRISASMPGFKGKPGGQQAMLRVAEYLIEKERADKNG